MVVAATVAIIIATNAFVHVKFKVLAAARALNLAEREDVLVNHDRVSAGRADNFIVKILTVVAAIAVIIVTVTIVKCAFKL